MRQRKSGWKVASLGFFLLLFSTTAVVLGKGPPLDKLSAASSPASRGRDTASPGAEASPSPATPASEYAGGDACFACHDIEAAFKKNPHYKSWTDESLPWSERGCETCHGAGQAHIDGGGDVGQILSFKTASPEKIIDTCLDCHLQQVERANFEASEHGLNSVACTQCHSVHTPYERAGLLKARTPALCYDCHGEVRPEFNKPFHHKVHEGLMRCMDCHNQHGGFNRKQLREATGTDQVCFTCHADKQGPFVFEHAPVKLEGCTLCHQPHGSVNPRLLKRSRVNTLCLECHTETPGIPEAVGVPTFHSQSNPRYTNCTVCHVNIHGSNLSPVFFE